MAFVLCRVTRINVPHNSGHAEDDLTHLRRGTYYILSTNTRWTVIKLFDCLEGTPILGMLTDL